MILIRVLVRYHEFFKSISITWTILLKMTVISVALRLDAVVNYFKHIFCLATFSSNCLVLRTVFLDSLQNLAGSLSLFHQIFSLVVVDTDRGSGVGVESFISFAEDYFVGKGRMLSVHLFLKYLLAPVALPDRAFDICHRLMQG